jgi:3-mercaptopyruvate sulfurtransferase SseA
MKIFLASLSLMLLTSWATPLFAAQAQSRFPTDPQTRWALGAKQKPADELKRQLDAGNKTLIIDVREPAQFAKETLPGAINIPLAELEGHLRKMPKDTFIVFT